MTLDMAFFIFIYIIGTVVSHAIARQIMANTERSKVSMFYIIFFATLASWLGVAFFFWQVWLATRNNR